MDPSELPAFLATKPLHTEAGGRAGLAEHACLAAMHREDYDGVMAFANLSRGLWDYVEAHGASTPEQKAESKFGWTRATMFMASLQRREGEYEEAMATFDSIEERLSGTEDLLMTPETKPKGLLNRFRRQEVSDERAMMMMEWFQISGALRMNQGVLFNVMGRHEDAMNAWKDAEEVLFDHIVKKLGPDADLETSGSVMKLWDNMLALSIKMGDFEQAGESIWKAVRLYSYYPMHDQEVPQELDVGICHVLGTINELPPAQRAQLNAALDPELMEIIDEWLKE